MNKKNSLSLGQVVKGYLAFGQLETALVNFKKDTDTFARMICHKF